MVLAQARMDHAAALAGTTSSLSAPTVTVASTSHSRRAHKIPLPAKFCGNHPDKLPEWLFSMQQYFLAAGTTDEVE